MCALDLGFPHWIAVLLLHWNALQIIWKDESSFLGEVQDVLGKYRRLPFPNTLSYRYGIGRVLKRYLCLADRWQELCQIEKQCTQVPGMEEKVKPDLFEAFPVVSSGLVRVWEARTVRPEINDMVKSVAFCSKELWLFPTGITLSLKVVRRAVEDCTHIPVCGFRCGRKVFTKSRSHKPKGLLIWWQGIWRGVNGSVWELGGRLDREDPEKSWDPWGRGMRKGGTQVTLWILVCGAPGYTV